MKKDTSQDERTHEAIGGEAIYLRIEQLQKGPFQFTDAGCPAHLTGKIV
jgi:hypothetical protein